MKFLPGTCPQCNGPLQLPTDRESVKCMYCGADIAVSDAIDPGPARIPAAAPTQPLSVPVPSARPNPSPPKNRSTQIGGLIGLVIFIVLVASQMHQADREAPSLPVVRPPDRSTASAPVDRGASRTTPGAFGDGLQIVGKDIKPGTYRTRTRKPDCYWARLAGFSGELGDIIANGNEDGPVIVTIKPRDAGFDCHDCGVWTPDLSAITTSPEAPFADGVFIVNVDIAPGTWRADSPEDCYWSRLRGFGGGLGDIIANNNGRGLVTIAKTDKGFKSAHCGTWTKVK
jgi:hypothetical protein